MVVVRWCGRFDVKLGGDCYRSFAQAAQPFVTFASKVGIAEVIVEKKEAYLHHIGPSMQEA